VAETSRLLNGRTSNARTEASYFPLPKHSKGATCVVCDLWGVENTGQKIINDFLSDGFKIKRNFVITKNCKEGWVSG
ncbi:MAG: hypothetical protein OXM55_06290, partial [Bdellovibrionales bacterium]|nr:hypothetical protein [Bdellovibrionales bacterium]